MGLFTIKGRSDSAHHPPYEKPQKRRKLEKKAQKDKDAVSVQLSYLAEPKFKNNLSFKQKLENEVNLLQFLEEKLREEVIDKEEIKNVFGVESFEDISEIFALIEKQKDFLFEQYIAFYNRPLVLNDQIIPLLEVFVNDIFSQTKLYFHTQTDHLAQEHLKLI